MERRRFIRSLCLISLFLFSFSETSWAGKAAVSGLVLDADNLMPAAGVTIVLENHTTSFTANTDTVGRYFFQSIPAGEYELYVSSAEYLNVPKPIVVSEDLCTVVNVGAIPVEVLDQIHEASSAGTEDATVAQTWKGSWRDDVGVKHRGGMTLKVNLSGNRFRGTATVTKAPNCGTYTVPCSGTLSGNAFHMQVNINKPCSGGKVKLVFDGILSPSGSKITGNFESFRGNQHENHYTFIMRKQ
jgi:hypothetical protein